MATQKQTSVEVKKFAGCLYLSEVYDNGELVNPGIWHSPGESTKLEVQIQQETETITGRTCTTFGKTIAARTKITGATGSLTLIEYKAKNVAMALNALVSTNTVAASTLSDKEVTLGQLNEWAEIGAGRLESVVVTDSNDIELVEQEDYNIDQYLGLIKPLKDALAGATVKVSAEASAINESRLSIGGAGVSGQYALRGHLVDEFSGKRVEVYLRRVTIASSNATVLVSEEGTTNEALEFTLTPQLPAGRSDYGTIDGLAMA